MRALHPMMNANAPDKPAARRTMPTGLTLLQGRPYTPAAATDIRRWMVPQLPFGPRSAR